MDEPAAFAELDAFGRELIDRGRDRTIADWDAILSGHMLGQRATRVRDHISNFDSTQVETLRWLIPQIVDSTLFSVLRWFEHEQRIDIRSRLTGQEVASLKEVSDGLAGELFGWTPKFTQQRYEPPG